MVNTSLEVVACWTLDYFAFSLVDVSGFSWGLCTTLDSVKCSIFVLSLVYLGLCQCRVTSDFALVLGAVGVELSCPPYLGIRTQHVRGVGELNVQLTWLVTFVRIGLCRSGKRFWRGTLIVGAVKNAFQAPPFPLLLRPLRPPLLRKPDAQRFPLSHSPLLLRGVTARGMWRVSFVWVLARSPLPLSVVRWGGGGGGLGFFRRFGCFLPRGGGSSGIIALSGVPCAHWPWPGSIFQPSGRWSLATLWREGRIYRRLLPLTLFTSISSSGSSFTWRASLCLISVSRGTCLVSGVVLSIHGPFVVAWTKALSPWLATSPFCLCAVSSLPVTVFWSLLGPTGALALSECLLAVTTIALTID